MITRPAQAPDDASLAPNGPDIEDVKAEARAQVRSQRKKMADSGQLRGEALTARLLERLSAVPDLTCVAAYVEMPTEPPVLSALDTLRQRGVEILLPRLGPQLKRAWATYQGREDLAQRAPGRPLEPGGDVLPEQAISRADAIVVPGLAVDGYGTRLGQGGGWYDRALTHARPEAPIIAVVWDHEVLGQPMLCEDHDVPVTDVVTPERIIRTLSGSLETRRKRAAQVRPGRAQREAARQAGAAGAHNTSRDEVG